MIDKSVKMSASGDGIDYRVGHHLKQEFGHQHKQFSIDAIMNKKKQTLQIGKTFFLRDYHDINVVCLARR